MLQLLFGLERGLAFDGVPRSANIVVVRDGRGEGHAIVVGNLNRKNKRQEAVNDDKAAEKKGSYCELCTKLKTCSSFLPHSAGRL